MKPFAGLLLAAALIVRTAPAAPGTKPQTTPQVTVRVDAGKVVGRVSRYLTGACIEDVNHEIYGGLYSQMVFGESFGEPAAGSPLKGFRAFGGSWKLQGEDLHAAGGEGPKLVSDHAPFAQGEVGVEVYFPDRRPGNAGLIVRVSRPGPGADNFDGYEVSLDPAGGVLRLGRHRHNWELLKDTPCEVPVGRWIPLVVRLTGPTLEVLVDGKSVLRYTDRLHPLPAGTFGLRPWQREARYRKLWVKTNGKAEPVPFVPHPDSAFQVSGMWKAVRRGTVTGAISLETNRPFKGPHSQRLTFQAGRGEIGVENQGLNRWGMNFVPGKPYEGRVWVRAEKPAELFVVLESRDGARVYAEKRLAVAGNDWRRLNFTLTPSAADRAGRLAVKLKQPGSVVVGHAFLQPGAWGRFKCLPVRRDVAEGLIDQGITVLRYGGSMVNAPEYRWKKMIGPRDRRPGYRGTWYPYSTNGWGIPDFLNFCEAAGFLAVPAFNMDETPQDMADFIEYVNGPAGSPWGRKRPADGHPAPYKLRHLELGNEERIDAAYVRKFKALAEAIWAKDPNVILVVGDFQYDAQLADPLRFTGAASRITNLEGHRQILELARRHGREVWFDVHVWTEGPGASPSLLALPTFVKALDRVAGGTRHKVVVFEFNAGNPRQRRALGNALAINAVTRLGPAVPIATSANCLQPDGQNDNGWDQGLLFLNPSQVWLQPPGYVCRMLARNYLPLLVRSEVSKDSLDLIARKSEDGKVLLLQVVNVGPQPVEAGLQINGFRPAGGAARVTELVGPLDTMNTAAEPRRIVPREKDWKFGRVDGTTYRFPPHSFTILRFP